MKFQFCSIIIVLLFATFSNFSMNTQKNITGKIPFTHPTIIVPQKNKQPARIVFNQPIAATNKIISMTKGKSYITFITEHLTATCFFDEKTEESIGYFAMRSQIEVINGVTYRIATPANDPQQIFNELCVRYNEQQKITKSALLFYSDN